MAASVAMSLLSDLDLDPKRSTDSTVIQLVFDDITAA